MEGRTENESEFDLQGIELIRGLMELYNLKQKDLIPIFKTKSIVSAILNYKRQLTTEHINKLAAFFRLPHTNCFLSNCPTKISKLCDFEKMNALQPRVLILDLWQKRSEVWKPRLPIPTPNLQPLTLPVRLAAFCD